MTTDLELIEKTTSPSGRYALAWGIPGVKGITKLVDNNQSLQLDTYKARNYVVERRTISIVGTLPLHTVVLHANERVTKLLVGRDYARAKHFIIGGNYTRAKNNSFMAAFWSRTEDWVLVMDHTEWEYNALYLGYRIAHRFHFIEIGDAVDKAVRAELRHRHPQLYDKVYREDQVDLCVDMGKAYLHPSMLLLDVVGGVPKDDNNPLNFRGRVDMHITAAADSIHTKITSLYLKPSRNGYW